MTTRILTLFGEEIVPELPPAGGGKRKSSDVHAQNPMPEDAAPITEEQEPQPEQKTLRKKMQPSTRKKREKVTEQKVPAEMPAILADWQPDKQYYTIGEVARLFGVNISHIRFWTNEFKLKVRTTRKGDRLYPPEIVQELRMIYHLVKERGFTLNGAKIKLKENKQAELEAVSLKQSLQSLRHQLIEIRSQLAGTNE